MATLMIQGTTSDAGKSTLVAGLCRLLKRRGVKVAPFKPQNMALNSAVTANGGEIGRSQALQAQACGLEPHTDMNPVLLKPNSDTGAQVIINGHPIANMEAGIYHDYKPVARAAVLAAHQRLNRAYAMVIAEGAGSPAEINLREGDIANMGFAEAVDCPVILVADIDRGGVFAHLVGTLQLLSATEQARVTGFVINRFRGDLALLQPGLDWLEERTGKPVLGVVPYLTDLYLDAEDALAQAPRRANALLRVVVPVFSRISNHTDFDSLRLHPQISLEFVPPGRPLPACDLIILPGSKNVRRDLALLRASSWEADIQRHLRFGGKLLGICGGFQMLGKRIDDPLGIEGEAGASEGLALLDMHTELMSGKQLHRVTGRLLLKPLAPVTAPMPPAARAEGATPARAPLMMAGTGADTGGGVTKPAWLQQTRVDGASVTELLAEAASIEGYEIHCGISTGPALANPLVALDRGALEGAVDPGGQILGTYIHGLLDHPTALGQILRWAGLAAPAQLDIAAIRETQLERLADTLEAVLDQAWLADLTLGTTH